ncbi:acetylcholinesterase-1-like isoform X1 [Dermacentor silvarum]|uniref:acetylcholinesterase-1-like isoform X1 n=1 Tax=Dermacentor silvarum TaxID=543639 RepID=UPI002100D12A|nr:acetylcholinesterase-1-like isoform X1 [Dermacentor silvarum]
MKSVTFAVVWREICPINALIAKTSVLFLFTVTALASDAPVIRIDSGLVTGQRIEVGGKQLYAYLGIPYAQPPIGDYRFRKPERIAHWEGVYNASSKPKPCRQLPIPLVGRLSLNYSGSSEDCLYMNVWTPSSACLNSKTENCKKKLPVVVFIHGGGFQWGDSALFLHDPANSVALSGIVYVTFNYRVGLHGFLSLEIPELPGNVGLWDQNLALKWVRKNIAAFGGNPDEITVDGQSAGSISAALQAASPHSKGLFQRLILQSGLPMSLAMGEYFRGKGKFISIAGFLGCYDSKRTLDEQLTESIGCLRRMEPAELITKLESLDLVQQTFAPNDNDEFLPFSVASSEPWSNLNVKELIIGTTENEAGIFFHLAIMTFPELVEILMTEYRTVCTIVITQALGLPMMQARSIVSAYFGDGDDDISYEELRDIVSQMIGDVLFDCPAQLFADTTSKSGVKTYRYVFAHKGSHSIFPKWMGVTHGEDVLYTLGSLPFLKDKSRYTDPFGDIGKRFLATQDYTAEDEGFMKEVVSAWNSFASTGKPVIPHLNVDWPEYTMGNPQMLVLKPNNYTIVQDTKRERCKLWKPVLYKSDDSLKAEKAPALSLPNQVCARPRRKRYRALAKRTSCPRLQR